jgi:hypothetical protein
VRRRAGPGRASGTAGWLAGGVGCWGATGNMGATGGLMGPPGVRSRGLGQGPGPLGVGPPGPSPPLHPDPCPKGLGWPFGQVSREWVLGPGRPSFPPGGLCPKGQGPGPLCWPFGAGAGPWRAQPLTPPRPQGPGPAQWGRGWTGPQGSCGGPSLAWPQPRWNFKAAPAIQPRASSTTQGRAVGVALIYEAGLLYNVAFLLWYFS